MHDFSCTDAADMYFPASIFRDKNGETIYAILIGKEREQINQKFDELVLIQTLAQTLYITN
jgi:hypothetical protein